MNIINLWDWKFKIGIYRDVYMNVVRNLNYFSVEEKEIYEKIIDYHIDRISLDSILDILIENKYDSWENTGINEINFIKPRLIPIDGILYELFQIKVEKALKNNPNLNYEINELFNAACHKKNNQYDTVEEIFRVILGDYYDEIAKLLPGNYQFIDKTKEKIEVENTIQYANKYIEDLGNNIEIKNTFGDNNIPGFDIELVDGIGFAEWWDKDLTSRDKDLLLLFKNNDAMNKDDFQYTIYHEVYPGHGHFYNYARNNKETIKNFDHGAITLIEGWATFCEWNVKKTDYSNSLKNRGKEFLRVSLAKDISLDNKISTFYQNNIKRGYSKEQALNTVLYFTQYPTFLESYYLGALCIEVMINNKILKKPSELLNYLKNKTWGELFALWG